MTKFFRLPDKENEFNAYMVFVLSIIWAVIIGVIVSIGFIFFPDIWYRWLTFLGIAIFIAFFHLTVNQLGYVRFASWSLCIMLWLFITVPCYSAGGILAPGILSQMSVILTAGILIGWRGGLAIGLLTMSVDFVFVYLEINGNLPVPSVVHTPVTRWIGAIIPFGTILVLQYYATFHLRMGMNSLQNEIDKRKEIEVLKDRIVHMLEERVKELRLLIEISKLLQNDELQQDGLMKGIAEMMPGGWQYPEIASACISVSGRKYFSSNYKASEYVQKTVMYSLKGTQISIELSYSKKMPEADEGPFLKEERDMINMIAEMLLIDLDRRERSSEIKDYKYALDMAAIVSISSVDGKFTFVNDNFCKISKYTREELIGQHFGIIASDHHNPEFYDELSESMKNGKSFRSEFCNRAKDNSIYWVDATIVPFLDENGNVYQYLSINYDITEKKLAAEQIKESERLLKKITSQVPGNTYMFEIFEDGFTNAIFMNKGTDMFNHSLKPEDVYRNPESLRDILHEADKKKFNDVMKEAFISKLPINFQYRTVVEGHTRWRWMQAVPEFEADGKVMWYGATSDITPLVEYIASMEQIIFDIGHVIRRPVSNMLGLTQLINSRSFDEEDLKKMSLKLHDVSMELDKFINELNTVYNQKRSSNHLKIDVSDYIDKRHSLFS